MDDRPVNPYAPPVESADAAYQAPTERGGLSVSGQGWEIVTSMTKWMRIVSTFQFIAAGLIGVMGLAIVGLGGSASFFKLPVGAGMRGAAMAFGFFFTVLAVLFIFAAVWLRQSAAQFYDGVLSDAEQPLANGFRKLRLYLILYGILGLVANVAELIFLKRLVAAGLGD
jgi:hypothetical protein